MLESIYRTSGLRVGLFTSPHLVSFRERIQVNREWISPGEVVRLVSQMQELLQRLPSSNHPSFFELVTVLALRYFAEQRCELVVWETGLGGRLDATNIVAPLASVITNIELDHEQWLGSTLAQIAFEKAGIIKPGVPVLTATDQPSALDVIQARAAELSAPCTVVRAADSVAPPLDRLALPLLGQHQRINAALALATVRTLQALLPVDEASIRRGLEEVRWPGRLQLERLPDGRSVLLDGAHNPAGAATLRDALQQLFPGQKPTLVLGVLRDKDWKTMCRILVPAAARVVLVPVSSDRTAAPDELELITRQIRPGGAVQACHSLQEGLEAVRHDAFIVITGSLHLIGDAMESLGLVASADNERALNEWDASAAASRPAPAVVLPEPGASTAP